MIRIEKLNRLHPDHAARLSRTVVKRIDFLVMGVSETRVIHHAVRGKVRRRASEKTIATMLSAVIGAVRDLIRIIHHRIGSRNVQTMLPTREEKMETCNWQTADRFDKIEKSRGVGHEENRHQRKKVAIETNEDVRPIRTTVVTSKNARSTLPSAPEWNQVLLDTLLLSQGRMRHGEVELIHLLVAALRLCRHQRNNSNNHSSSKRKKNSSNLAGDGQGDNRGMAGETLNL
jgi:hypothetical protein